MFYIFQLPGNIMNLAAHIEISCQNTWFYLPNENLTEFSIL